MEGGWQLDFRLCSGADRGVFFREFDLSYGG